MLSTWKRVPAPHFRRGPNPLGLAGASATAVDAKTIYLCGGRDSSGFAGALSRFNTETQEWAGSFPPLDTPRAYHAALLDRAGGRILFIGGIHDGGVRGPSDARAFDLAAGDWAAEPPPFSGRADLLDRAIAGCAPAPAAFVRAVVGEAAEPGDWFVLHGGYRPALAPAAPPPPAAAGGGGGGGRRRGGGGGGGRAPPPTTPAAAPPKFLDDVVLVNASTGLVLAVEPSPDSPSPPPRRAYHALIAAPCGRLYVVGGREEQDIRSPPVARSDFLWEFDPATRQWSRSALDDGSAPGPEKRSSVRAVLAGDRALVYGGDVKETREKDGGLWTLALPQAGGRPAWSRVDDPPTAAPARGQPAPAAPSPRQASAVVLHGGWLYVFGGFYVGSASGGRGGGGAPSPSTYPADAFRLAVRASAALAARAAAAAAAAAAPPPRHPALLDSHSGADGDDGGGWQSRPAKRSRLGAGAAAGAAAAQHHNDHHQAQLWFPGGGDGPATQGGAAAAGGVSPGAGDALAVMASRLEAAEAATAAAIGRADAERAAREAADAARAREAAARADAEAGKAAAEERLSSQAAAVAAAEAAQARLAQLSADLAAANTALADANEATNRERAHAADLAADLAEANQSVGPLKKRASTAEKAAEAARGAAAKADERADGLRVRLDDALAAAAASAPTIDALKAEVASLKRQIDRLEGEVTRAAAAAAAARDERDKARAAAADAVAAAAAAENERRTVQAAAGDVLRYTSTLASGISAFQATMGGQLETILHAAERAAGVVREHGRGGGG